MLDENYFDEYRESLIAMAELTEYTRKTISDTFGKLIKMLYEHFALAGQSIMSNLPLHFMEASLATRLRRTEENVFVDPLRGRRIQFDTIHGVKGETHDATLYLETEMKKASDIARVLPWLGIGRPSSSSLYDYSRKLVYVGMSRPKKLLCLAIQESTYIKSKDVFQGWEIIDLRERKGGQE